MFTLKGECSANEFYYPKDKFCNRKKVHLAGEIMPGSNNSDMITIALLSNGMMKK